MCVYVCVWGHFSYMPIFLYIHSTTKFLTLWRRGLQSEDPRATFCSITVRVYDTSFPHCRTPHKDKITVPSKTTGWVSELPRGKHKS